MRKSIFVLSTVLVGMAMLFAVVHSQEDMTYVDNSAFEKPHRTAAVFIHDEHNETAGIEDCAECHHVYDEQGNKLEDESSEDQSCADCHEPDDDGSKPGLRKAYHLNCKGCHLDKQKGPVTCGECHPNQ